MRKRTKIIITIAAALTVCAAIACLCFLHLIYTNLEPVERCFSVLSPDGSKIAAIECEDQGALGGRTYVYIRERAYNNPSPSIKGGKKVVDCGFLYPEEIEIRWISDTELQFNQTTICIN